jgi:hypothetical protein
MVVKQKIQLIIGDNGQNDQPYADDGPAFGESRRTGGGALCVKKQQLERVTLERKCL